MIRSAKQDEAEMLTNISFASKGYWHYPQDFFDIWNRELTISSEYIEENDVFVYELDGAVVGYYSIVELPEDIEVSGIKIKKGFWLEHMFIEPRHIGKGIGSRMFHHLRKRCKALEIKKLRILADPNSKGFYEKMGCQYLNEFPSTIKNRTTPYLLLRA
ncbi:MAG: GNAT family N-acetyltransferase [Deltaproteobacteria bacterium]|nr:GNAT family N-acetyltransferase [Deltaproteobacteria bacterium]